MELSEQCGSIVSEGNVDRWVVAWVRCPCTHAPVGVTHAMPGHVLSVPFTHSQSLPSPWNHPPTHTHSPRSTSLRSLRSCSLPGSPQQPFHPAPFITFTPLPLQAYTRPLLPNPCLVLLATGSPATTV